ncbi:alpha/beta fold hydrolase [Myxococcus fulvus]|uniref:alpha/beta fold hydrolase n=1 Tax=Myxococcus TaxID=32 RepID=UPI0020BFA736|nr:alpha/beta fold hydrolase [Myxococcus fulvus]MCK8503245.1 lipase family protein [Myxococcus fulvus]
MPVSFRCVVSLAVLVLACSRGSPQPQQDELPPFYRTPDSLPTSAQGDVLRHEPLTGVAALEQAGSNELVLYRSDAVAGERPIAVSGIIALPKGEPPEGGWPVIAWAHGTVGVADKCAPSRDVLGSSAHWFNQAPHRMLNYFLSEKKWAVVMTDYEGLGTEGRHPYLLGRSQARGVLDSVVAAHKLYPGKLSKKYAIVGHSQGGQAALFSAAEAPERLRGKDLELVGVLAYAPGSAMHLTFPLAVQVPEPSPEGAFIPLFLAGASEGDPEGVKLEQLLKPQALRLFAEVDTKCRTELSLKDSWGSFVPKGNVMSETANWPPLLAQLRAMHPGYLRIGVPVRLVQGALDARVNPAQTWVVRNELIARQASVEYVGCPVADHFGVLGDDIPGTVAWLTQRFGGSAPPDVPSSCRVLTELSSATP